MKRFFIPILCLMMAALGWHVAQTDAQDQCGVMDTVDYPVDTGVFQLAQAFGVPSPRHDGRYHTGEDWFIGRGATFDQPVRAIGRGVVTLSNPHAWGLDGGVVIIRHTLPDGATIYSQYGHLMESGSIQFPARLDCVQAGEVIGVIGEARPAPHLHFEIRVPSNVNQGIADTPGPRYTAADPRSLGWRHPSQMIRNLNARLHPAALWHSATTTRPPAPPLVLNDNSLLVIDGERLRRITRDGRVLWRVALTRRAVGLHGHAAQSFITYADGSIMRVDVESGGLSDGWRIDDFLPSAPPLIAANSRIYHTADNTLTALSLDQREILWRTPDVPRYDRAIVTRQVIALVIGAELWTLRASDGERLGVAILADGAALAPHPDGGLIAYTRGGLWRVGVDGRWSLLHDTMRGGGERHGVLLTGAGRLYTTDGAALRAYGEDGVLLWESRLPSAMSGAITLETTGGIILAVSTHGHFAILHEGGGVCGAVALYGEGGRDVWYTLGDDAVLRVNVGDQLMGFDWERLARGC
ncbi:MAG: hypothetical protein EA396_11180 [Anaerolineaceae bacterium]|nr:MAG: hypothetical protein EA396_11180 [Anaerolineaceae bacterium]